jgi:hypothetical protein
MERGMAAPKPIFYVVLRDGKHWLVEAEWPDGTIEHINAFKAYFDAATWVNSQSKAWLKKRGVSGGSKTLLLRTRIRRVTVRSRRRPTAESLQGHRR